MREVDDGSRKRNPSWLNSSNSDQKEGNSRRFLRIRSSLTFIVVSVMVFLALIPVILIVTGSYIRTRNFIQEQTYHQLESLVQSQSPQLESIASENQNYLSDLFNHPAIRDFLVHLVEISRR